MPDGRRGPRRPAAPHARGARCSQPSRTAHALRAAARRARPAPPPPRRRARAPADRRARAGPCRALAAARAERWSPRSGSTTNVVSIRGSGAVQPPRVPWPPHEPRHVVDGHAGVAELAQDARGERVDHDPLGPQPRDEVGQPAPQRGAVAVQRLRHADHGHVAHHPRVGREARRGDDRRPVADAQRVQHRARPHEMPEPAADGVVEDHGAARRSGVGALVGSVSAKSSA